MAQARLGESEESQQRPIRILVLILKRHLTRESTKGCEGGGKQSGWAFLKETSGCSRSARKHILGFRWQVMVVLPRVRVVKTERV